MKNVNRRKGKKNRPNEERLEIVHCSCPETIFEARCFAQLDAIMVYPRTAPLHSDLASFRSAEANSPGHLTFSPSATLSSRFAHSETVGFGIEASIRILRADKLGLANINLWFSTIYLHRLATILQNAAPQMVPRNGTAICNSIEDWALKLSFKANAFEAH